MHSLNPSKSPKEYKLIEYEGLFAPKELGI